jgi:hypothetical protein
MQTQADQEICVLENSGINFDSMSVNPVTKSEVVSLYNSTQHQHLVLEKIYLETQSLLALYKQLTPEVLKEHPEALSKLRYVGEKITELEVDWPLYERSDFRTQLVKLLKFAVLCWEISTAKSKVELADDSKIWAVTIDDGRLRTRTLDRYLKIAKLPNTPNWKDVIRTVSFVLSTAPLAPRMREQLECGLEKLLRTVSDI